METHASRPRSLLGLIYLVVLLAIAFPQAESSGVFELRLISFINQSGRDQKGECCSNDRNTASTSTAVQCPQKCSTYFRVCLKHFQREIDDKCTFGQLITPVLANNSFDSSDLMRIEGFENPLQFRFNFSWPGTFSLIVEAWHASTAMSGHSNANQMITKIATQTWLNVNSHWTRNVSHADGKSLTFAYRVVCEENYYGENCETLCKPRDDQFGHFTCLPNGEKRCLQGWTGSYCDKAICLPGCHHEHGECKEPYQCNCKYGWTGPKCDECIKYPGCLHGTCNTSWQCICEEGWGGLLCNQDLNYCTNHKPCKNGGTCKNTGQGFYTCSCPEGYTGKNCETPLTNCAQQPCHNGGICKQTSFLNYTCDCPLGYYGKNCDTLASTCVNNPCMHGGSCLNGPSGYQCICAPGYVGMECEQKQSDCDPNPCMNGGSCLAEESSYKCVCRAGFTGENCEKNIDDCIENPCLNGGGCVDEVNSYRCSCVPGFVGSMCEQNVDDCLTIPCANGGTCTDLINDYKCSCAAGFTGKDCSVNIDECASNPCLNGGTCRDKVDEFQCICAAGFYGSKCENNENYTSSDVIGESMTASSVRSSHSDNLLGGELETGLSADLSAQQVALISVTSAIVPLMVIVAVGIVLLYKRRKRLLDRETKEDEDETRRQNEQNSAHLKNNKCLDSGANIIVNSLDKTSSLYHLNRQKSATLSKLTNENYDSSLVYSRQIAIANESNKCASLLRSKSNNKLINSETDSLTNNLHRPFNKLAEHENKPKSYISHQDAIQRRDSLPHLQSVPNPILNSESSISNSNEAVTTVVRSSDSSVLNNGLRPSRGSGRSVNSIHSNSIYVIEDQIYASTYVDPQQKLFATQV